MSTAELVKEFTVTTDDLVSLIGNFHSEMRDGLSASGSSLKMIPSYVFHLPKGNEKGSFLAIDLGGSNFRLLRTDLTEGGEAWIGPHTYQLTKEHMTSDAATLFGFIADCLADFAPETRDAPTTTLLGFTFSFPVINTSIRNGVLSTWTKGFSASGCEGEDIVSLLENEIAKRRLNIKVGAIINDTVGTMMAKTLAHKDCFVGLIIGTGTNACYYEKLDRIAKWQGGEAEKYKDEKGVVINIEWGNFGQTHTHVRGSGLPSYLPWTAFDQTVDVESIHPGIQRFEKMISGKYQGEVLRQLFLASISNNSFLNGIKSEAISKQEAVLTEDVSNIESDSSPEFSNTRAIFSRLGYSSISEEDCLTALHLCQAVSVRAARLTAAACAAVILFAGGEATKSCTIAVDGSVFNKHPHFHNIMLATLDELRPHFAFGKVTFVAAHGGSGSGAALVVAASAAHGLSIA